MSRSPIAASAFAALALVIWPGVAPACDDVREGVTRVLQDDTPACLSVRGLSGVSGGASRLAMSNRCAYPITLRCDPAAGCPEWVDVTEAAPLVLAAGEARDVEVAQGVVGGSTRLLWQGDGAMGAVVYGFEITGPSIGSCGGGEEEESGCAAAPGHGAGGAGWLALGLLGLWMQRRRR